MDAGIQCRHDDAQTGLGPRGKREDDKLTGASLTPTKTAADHEGGSHPMTPVKARRANASRLATSRAAAACDTEGLATAFERACDSGLIDDFDDLDQYLEAVLEGEADDVLATAGWRACARPGRCLRARRCLAHAGGM
jgi:hypothetical protein